MTAGPRRARTGTLVLAFDLGGTKLAGSAITGGGRIVRRETQPVDRRSRRAPIEQMIRMAAALASPRLPAAAFAAAAVAVPGLVRRTGTVWAPNLAWDRMPCGRLLAAALDLPVTVESDRNAAILGETWRGAARGCTDAFTVIVGTGIGAGIVSGGTLLRGAHELSGCAGWMRVPEPAARPGAPVPLEAIAAGPAIARIAQPARRTPERAARRAGGVGATARDVAAAARAGDRAARAIFEAVGRSLGYGVGNMISVLDPQVVVIGGGLAAAADLFLPALRETALGTCQPLAARAVRIVASRLQSDANLLGMAALAWAVAASGDT